MKTVYRQGVEVRKEFERTMIALFRASKPKERKQPNAANEHKSEKADKD